MPVVGKRRRNVTGAEGLVDFDQTLSHCATRRQFVNSAVYSLAQMFWWTVVVVATRLPVAARQLLECSRLFGPPMRSGNWRSPPTLGDRAFSTPLEIKLHIRFQSAIDTTTVPVVTK